MRTVTVFNDVNAGNSHSYEMTIECGQDMRFLIQAIKTGTDGNPRLIVEESINGSIWTALENTETWNNYTEIDDVIAIKDSYFMGAMIRIRLEPNSTTTGSVKVLLGYKTKV